MNYKMRYLNKIVFINSATIKYSEIFTGGNVHLIGTQGVGKSTILRAILFFYNADSQKLGIKPGQKSFSEYYFPFQNSYIIYEIVKETGIYSILCYKSQGKVCFRFFEGEYNKDYFIKDNYAFESWEQISNQLNQSKIYYSRKIDRYEEYRDILYGNNEGKSELKKFALMESKQYQNIPRTIQNVLLNSELKAEFIKQTIIRSLEDEDIVISLEDYQHHLTGFESQLSDIRKWTEKNKNGEIPVKTQSEKIIQLRSAIKFLEREKITLAKQLAWALNSIEKSTPKIQKKLETQELKEVQIKAKLTELDSKFQSKKENIQNDISVFDNKIKEAETKAQEYKKINIEAIIEAVSKKDTILVEQGNLNKEKGILTSKYAEITQKYSMLLTELQNQLKSIETDCEKQKLTLQSNFLSFKENTTNQYVDIIKEIRNNSLLALDTAKNAVNEKKDQSQEILIKKAEINHKRFYENEIEQLKTTLQKFKNDKINAESQVKFNNEQIKTFQTQWETEENGKKESHNLKLEKLNDSVLNIQNEVKSIETKIMNSKDSFYGWLNEKYPNWENTIGKVCTDDILFHNELSPEIINSKELNFFGVKIDLREITKKVKTVADYEKDKEELNGQIELQKKQILAASETLESEIIKLKTKYQPKIKASKDLVNEYNYTIETNTAKTEEATNTLNDLTQKAANEKQSLLKEIQKQIDQLSEEIIVAGKKLKALEEQISIEEKAKQAEKDNLINEEEKKTIGAKAEIDITFKAKKAEHSQRELEIKDNQKNELSDKGANTSRITEIDKQLEKLKAKLEYIENNWDKVVEYKKDKRELFDKEEEFKIKKKRLQEQLINEQQKHTQQKGSLFTELTELTRIISELKKILEDYEADLNELDLFKSRNSESYSDLNIYFSDPKEENAVNKPGRELIRELEQKDYSRKDRLGEMKETINKFLGNFSEKNIFNFKIVLIDSIEYVQFADELNDFIEEKKIEQFEKRINERFASIITSIGKETGSLMSKGGEIQKIIHSINKDFDQRNFVGAIKKIELQWDNSSNPVVSILLAIKKFNDENINELGTPNLFSGNDQGSKNKKAVDLLKELIKQITTFGKKTISLSDSFELKFRIQENQNDTGWVEKLANVGSDGTDILVKAMINIMLLNVFKDGASKRFKDFRLHCVMDEIGKLHPNNIKGILKFANDRNILLVNGSPTENNAIDYKHIYKLEKDEKSFSKIKRIITNHALA
jgi:chromosome segregation ATPase